MIKSLIIWQSIKIHNELCTEYITLRCISHPNMINFCGRLLYSNPYWHWSCTFHNNNELMEWFVNVNILCKQFDLYQLKQNLLLWKRGEIQKEREGLIQTCLMLSSYAHLEKTYSDNRRRESLRKLAYFSLLSAVSRSIAGFKSNWGA